MQSRICSVISLHFESDSMSRNFQGPFSGEGFLYCEAVLWQKQLIHGNIVKKTAKSTYFCSSYLFTKWSKSPISIEYNIVSAWLKGPMSLNVNIENQRETYLQIGTYVGLM